MLSDPVFKDELKWSSHDRRGKTVASRLKNLLSEEGKGSFQRVRKEQMLDPASTWADYPVPRRVNVLCNSAAISSRSSRKRMSFA